MIPVFIGITFIAFLMVRLAPGDPIATMYSPETIGNVDREALERRLGLDQPLPVQYARMMAEFFSGELKSFQTQRPTITMILELFPTTLLLATLAVMFALLIGIPVALFSAARPYSWFDNIATTGTLVGLSLPQFWLSLILILIFSERLKILPATGIRPVGAAHGIIDSIPHLIMPVGVLVLGLLPAIVRYTRSTLIDVFAHEYIRTARAKGLRERRVIFLHALRNGLIPVVTLIGILFPALLGGAVLIETIFGLPGIGRLALRAAQNRDMPLILTLNMFSAILVLLSTLITDLIYAYLDPRISLGARRS